MGMVLVSKCCAGVKCRYRHNGFFRKFLAEIGESTDFIAVCPEMLGGLPTPREGCSVKGKRGKDGLRIIGRKTGRDYTEEYNLGAKRTLDICLQNGIRKAYLLKDSPSCGKDYGLTAIMLENHGIEVIPV